MTENTNMRVWSVLEKTNPEQTKAFTRSGGFKGTAVKPIYCDQRMTELFGPCGEGWGINEPNFQVVPTEKEILVYCTVSIWHGSRENTVFGVGGDKVVAMQSNGAKTSDEAFKMAFTDAIGNAYKHIGMSADIHMGRFDDAKYVAEMQKEADEAKKAGKPEEPPHVKQAQTIIHKAASITSHEEYEAYYDGIVPQLEELKQASTKAYEHVMAQLNKREATLKREAA